MVKNFSKTIFTIVFVVFLGLSFINGVTAVCYEKRVYPEAPGAKPEYLTECTAGGSISCTVVDDSYCGNTSNGNSESQNQSNSEYADNIDTLASGTETVSCGTVTSIPSSIPKTVNIIYKVIQIFVPLALIIFGMFDMAKAVMGQKEDEIKKGQQTLIKRVVAAAIVFFVFAAIKLVVSFVSDSSDVMECLNCFIDNDCKPEVKADGGNNADPTLDNPTDPANNQYQLQ